MSSYSQKETLDFLCKALANFVPPSINASAVTFPIICAKAPDVKGFKWFYQPLTRLISAFAKSKSQYLCSILTKRHPLPSLILLAAYERPLLIQLGIETHNQYICILWNAVPVDFPDIDRLSLDKWNSQIVEMFSYCKLDFGINRAVYLRVFCPFF